MGSWHGSEKYDAEVITMQHVIHWHLENTRACKLGCGLAQWQSIHERGTNNVVTQVPFFLPLPKSVRFEGLHSQHLFGYTQFVARNICTMDVYGN